MALFAALRPRFFLDNLPLFVVLSVEMLLGGLLGVCLLTFALALRLH